LPQEWIIVNDGSSDKTGFIIEKYSAQFSWIRLINLTDRGYYLPGPGVINTFYKGFESIQRSDWQFIVKLDCDLSFESDYFEKIIFEFEKSKKLGIASGSIYLPEGRKYIRERIQGDHPVGPLKVYRKECFNEIGGLKRIPGWDLADCLAAQMKGWQTKVFYYKIIHYRRSGARRGGLTGGRFITGRFHYRFGYFFPYILLKGFYRIFDKPYFLGSIGLVSGYLYAYFSKEEKLFDPEMISFLRNKQKNYLLNKIGVRLNG
jgi:glycosyltransferase involved in cell wall biosynthesis